MWTLFKYYSRIFRKFFFQTCARFFSNSSYHHSLIGVVELLNGYFLCVPFSHIVLDSCVLSSPSACEEGSATSHGHSVGGARSFFFSVWFRWTGLGWTDEAKRDLLVVDCYFFARRKGHSARVLQFHLLEWQNRFAFFLQFCNSVFSPARSHRLECNCVELLQMNRKTTMEEALNR